jgi:hypothetical protein
MTVNTVFQTVVLCSGQKTINPDAKQLFGCLETEEKIKT